MRLIAIQYFNRLTALVITMEYRQQYLGWTRSIYYSGSLLRTDSEGSIWGEYVREECEAMGVWPEDRPLAVLSDLYISVSLKLRSSCMERNSWAVTDEICRRRVMFCPTERERERERHVMKHWLIQGLLTDRDFNMSAFGIWHGQPFEVCIVKHRGISVMRDTEMYPCPFGSYAKNLV